MFSSMHLEMFRVAPWQSSLSKFSTTPDNPVCNPQAFLYSILDLHMILVYSPFSSFFCHMHRCEQHLVVSGASARPTSVCSQGSLSTVLLLPLHRTGLDIPLKLPILKLCAVLLSSLATQNVPSNICLFVFLKLFDLQLLPNAFSLLCILFYLCLLGSSVSRNF